MRQGQLRPPRAAVLSRAGASLGLRDRGPSDRASNSEALNRGTVLVRSYDLLLKVKKQYEDNQESRGGLTLVT